MATSLGLARSPRAFHALRLIARTSPSTLRRAFLSTLPQNPHVYVHETSLDGKKQFLYTYLSSTPPNPSLAIATSPTNPPSPETLQENPHFLELLHAVVRDHAVDDPEIQAQAAMYASQAGSSLGSGGSFFPHQPHQRRRKGSTDGFHAPASGTGSGAGGASSQGGMGGAGRGGFVHVSDQRNPPDWGRVAWPEDILGSLEVDGQGGFVEPRGRYQRSGTYRVMTREGFLGLSGFLRERVREEVGRVEGR